MERPIAGRAWVGRSGREVDAISLSPIAIRYSLVIRHSSFFRHSSFVISHSFVRSVILPLTDPVSAAMLENRKSGLLIRQ
jgi:hypothetical protein